MATSSSQNIPLMSWDGDLTENFKLYKHKLQLYFDDENVKDKKSQARKILRSIGDNGLRLLYGSPFSTDDEQDPVKLFTFYDNQFP